MNALPELKLPQFELPEEIVQKLEQEDCDLLRDHINEAIVRETFRRAMFEAYHQGLVTGRGRANAALIFADRYGAPEELEKVIAAMPGRKRATVSKLLCTCRRNDALPLRMPRNARDGGWDTRRANAGRRATAPRSKGDLTKSKAA